jgi:16S rRNA processing protein RimM
MKRRPPKPRPRPPRPHPRTEALEPARLVVGRIVTAHGIVGECAVEVLSDAPERFATGAKLGAGDPADEEALRTLTIAKARPHQKKLLVKFREVTDRNGAEALRGTLLSIPAAEAIAPEEGTFYPHQLEGMAVVNEAGEPLGSLDDVLSAPASDIWVVRTPDGRRVMVPAVEEFVRDVDLDAGRIVLAPIGGMFD